MSRVHRIQCFNQAAIGSLSVDAISWVTSRGTTWFSLVIMALIVSGWALAIELGQVLLPSRVADLTDVMVCTAGGWAGLFLTARLTMLRTRHLPLEGQRR